MLRHSRRTGRVASAAGLERASRRRVDLRPRARLAAAQGGQHDAQDGPCHYGNFEGFLPRMIDIAALQAPE
jgi:hypothetical protein